MLKIVQLSKQFYADYSDCPEILQKVSRPHVQIQIEMDGLLYCVPFRSDINHPYVFWTDKNNGCGLDFSKTVIITDSSKYIDRTKQPVIRQDEFDALKGKEKVIMNRLKKYIKEYKWARRNLHIPRNKMLVSYSALQYFDKYL